MSEGVKRPFGLKKWLFRLPIYFYRARLGWIFGRRFLLLNHVGRKSGQPRQAVLEVVRYDKATDTHYIAAGFGHQSHWYQNIVATPKVVVKVGFRQLLVEAKPLSLAESGEMMVWYAAKYPRLVRGLLGMVGHQVDGTEAGYRELGEQQIPFVALVPIG
ncbi:MAG: nitroreductase family deazaflavin-dependent oxidoreductase [Chloroflexota bacterium]